MLIEICRSEVPQEDVDVEEIGRDSKSESWKSNWFHLSTVAYGGESMLASNIVADSIVTSSWSGHNGKSVCSIMHDGVIGMKQNVNKIFFISLQPHNRTQQKSFDLSSRNYSIKYIHKCSNSIYWVCFMHTVKLITSTT